MLKTSSDPRRVQVWVAIADHFLDTETRQDIPLTALRCVEAGLSPEEARLVWRDEVTPAVGFNLSLVAGEWAYWDHDWLVAEIERRRRCVGAAGWLRWRDRLRPLAMPDVWESISRSMEALAACPGEQRGRSARDLAFLAGHAFDFCPRDARTLDDEDLARIRGLFPEPFRGIAAPALGRDLAKACRKIAGALQMGASR